MRRARSSSGSVCADFDGKGSPATTSMASRWRPWSAQGSNAAAVVIAVDCATAADRGAACLINKLTARSHVLEHLTALAAGADAASTRSRCRRPYLPHRCRTARAVCRLRLDFADSPKHLVILAVAALTALCACAHRRDRALSSLCRPHPSPCADGGGTSHRSRPRRATPSTLRCKVDASVTDETRASSVDCGAE